jgi:branched-chain amino acid transport system ATP-binding protein
MLELDGLTAGYGDNQVLFGVSLEVSAGEVVTLMGRNGMGKTTTISALMGILRPSGGDVRFMGRPIGGWPAYRVAQCGLGLVPEGRQIFPNLTVRENLVATAANRTGRATPWTLEGVLELFPALAERLESMGALLSGGEQQMLAIGRALLTNPHLLILDEATEGLAPLVRADIWRVLGRLKEAGQAILIVDKNVAALAALADRHYLLAKGRIVWQGSSAELAAAAEIRHRHLGIA